MKKTTRFILWLASTLAVFAMAFAPAGSVFAQANNNDCTPGKAPHGLGYYVVQKGESAASIASKFHLDVQDVLFLNSGASFSRGSFVLLPSTEAPGMWDNQLFCNATAQAARSSAMASAGGIPVTGGKAGTTAATVNTTCEALKAPKGLGYYVVGKGETAASIARKFGVSLEDVLLNNSNTSFARGRLILLPSAEAPGMWNNAAFCGAH
jgi:LysM repeat protein